MKCLEAGMNDLAGEENAVLLVGTIAPDPVIIVLNMLSYRLKK